MGKKGFPWTRTPEEIEAEAKAFFDQRMYGDAADFVYHWTKDGEPANDATRKLQREDPRRYCRMRPALDVVIGSGRMDQIMRDVGLELPAKGYTADELRFRARIEEEVALMEKDGLILDWKPDLEVPGQ